MTSAETTEPFRDLGLTPDEYERIRHVLGRRPVGGSAGVVDIGDGWAVAFTVRSHNHPSSVEPYQGAATGVGVVVRAASRQGARPVALLDSLRFGALDHPDTRRVAAGVVAGIADHGNGLGLANIGGEVQFDPCYQGGPLVNVLCLGVLRHDETRVATATGVGTVTGTGRLVVTRHGETVVDVPRSVAQDGPDRHRPSERPAWLDARQADLPDGLPRPSTGDELRALVLRMAASPNLCSRAWVTDRFDQDVRGDVALAMPDDAGVVRVDEESGLGVAVAMDGNGRFAALDPYEGARLALAEAYRNVVTIGARPAAVTDCLNLGPAEQPDVMWQLERAVAGLADGCLELGVPVSGGDVSFGSSTGDVAVHPTPVVGVLGVFDDVARRTPSGWREPGQVIYLLGATREELAGSQWAWVEHAHLGGLPPKVDLAAEKLLGDLLVNASRDGLVDAAHDLSDGGLAQALVESCLRHGVGARVWLDEICRRDGVSPFVALFAESTARAVVALPRSEEIRFTDMCTARGYPVARIGVVDDAAGPDGEQALDVQGLFTIGLDELAAAHTGTLPAALGA